MSVTTNSGVVEVSSGSVHLDVMDVTCLAISNNTASVGPVDLTLFQGDGTTVIMNVTIPQDGLIVLPFAGRIGKHFPSGITFTSPNVIVTAFLAD